MAKKKNIFFTNSDGSTVSADDIKKQMTEVFSIFESEDAEKTIKLAMGKYMREAKKIAVQKASNITTKRGVTPIGNYIGKLLKSSVKKTKQNPEQYWGKVKIFRKKAFDIGDDMSIGARNIHWWEGGTSTGVKANKFMSDTYRQMGSSAFNTFKKILDEYVDKKMKKLNG
ncbi:hypothetical protein [Carboxylicivirga sp. M1479]|uniref:hypothetical protein n=1 Tax=Carboxylicivirga sp. M1479 TaxID=2594476 RepID=UPI00117805A9|nr:hypothetical protein [Carboxylicivirga sp. M1479]TRX71508.1 hypothetical protein FNN09_05935 [Carboxylicivirga sp. M1479]